STCRFQKVGIQILGAVGQKHHERHKQHKIGENLPVTARGARNCSHCRRPMLPPCFRLLNFDTNVKSQKCWRSTNPEHGPPTPCGLYKPRRQCCQQITDGISALHHTRENSTPLSWRSFHGEGSSYAPLTAHPDSVDRP